MVNLTPILLAVFGLPAGSELWLILILILILFGGKKIPELMRGVGKGVGELQKGLQEGKRTVEEAMREEMDNSDQEPAARPSSAKAVPKE